MRTLLARIASYLPYREISDGDAPYLERYYLGTLCGYRFYLHHFVGSDPDRGLHDHPWPRAYSFILAGWYWEQTRAGMRNVKWFNRLTGDTFHRVILPLKDCPALEPAPGETGSPRLTCWTLFIHKADNVKPWGFWRALPDGSGTFEPYKYTREGSQVDWWKTAKSKRQLAKSAA